MMEHVKELLSGFLDQALPGPEKRRVESHLAGCAECREELSELRSVSSLVSGLPRRPLPAGFLQRLERRRNPRREIPSPWPFALPFPARAAAFALSSLLVMFVLREKIQVLFPVSPTAMISGSDDEERLRLERPQPLPTEALQGFARRSGPGKTLARAKGAPADPGLAAEEAPYTNAELQKNLEAEKKRLGIKKIVPPEPKRFTLGQLAGLRGASSAFETQKLLAAPKATTVNGAIPDLLSKREFRPAPGEPLAGGGGQAATATGQVLRSEEERAALWTRRGLRLAPPRADYSRQMLVVVFAPDPGWAVEIAAVKPSPERVTIQYRMSPLPEEARRPGSPVPYQARAIARTELPVVFEKLP